MKINKNFLYAYLINVAVWSITFIGIILLLLLIGVEF